MVSWSLVLNNINGLSTVVLSGLRGGIAPEDAVYLDAPEAKPSKRTIGATGDTIITRDMQSMARVLHVKVIKGGLAHRTLETQANAQQQADPNGEIPTFSGTVTHTTGDGTGGFTTQSFPFTYATIENFPDQTIRHVNAGVEQSILECEISGTFANNQLT